MEQDYFEKIEQTPEAIQEIAAQYQEESELSYDQCENMLTQMEARGWAFEYYLDGTPFNLRPKSTRRQQPTQ